MNLMSSEVGILRSLEPGIRYPLSRPESNHFVTVRGATLQICATWPVVKTSFLFCISIYPHPDVDSLAKAFITSAKPRCVDVIADFACFTGSFLFDANWGSIYL